MDFVSYKKMSKKQKHAYDKKKRVTWEFSPVDRIKPSKKVYKREKVRYRTMTTFENSHKGEEMAS